MDKEALLKGIKAYLGSTKLQFSDRTLDDYCSGVVKTVGSDVDVTDDFAAIHGEILKSFNGQYHADFSAELKKMRALDKPAVEPTKVEEPTKAVIPEVDYSDEPKWFVAYREISDKRIKELSEAFRKSEESRLLSEGRVKLEDDVRSRLSKSGVRVNEYVLKNSLRDIDVQSSDAAETAERLYNEGIKELGGSGFGFPTAGMPIGGTGSSNAEAWFKAHHPDA